MSRERRLALFGNFAGTLRREPYFFFFRISKLVTRGKFMPLYFFIIMALIKSMMYNLDMCAIEFRECGHGEKIIIMAECSPNGNKKKTV